MRSAAQTPRALDTFSKHVEPDPAPCPEPGARQARPRRAAAKPPKSRGAQGPPVQRRQRSYPRGRLSRHPRPDRTTAPNRSRAARPSDRRKVRRSHARTRPPAKESFPASIRAVREKDAGPHLEDTPPRAARCEQVAHAELRETLSPAHASPPLSRREALGVDHCAGPVPQRVPVERSRKGRRKRPPTARACPTHPT